MEVNNASMKPLNKMLELLNAFASLAGLPEFASIEGGANLEEALAPLQTAITALNTICGSIPV